MSKGNIIKGAAKIAAKAISSLNTSESGVAPVVTAFQGRNELHSANIGLQIPESPIVTHKDSSTNKDVLPRIDVEAAIKKAGEELAQEGIASLAETRVESVNKTLVAEKEKSSEEAKFTLNYVGRDINQSVYRNDQNQTDPEYLEILRLFGQLNDKGAKIFGYFETGGQEPGSHFMNYRNPDELFTKLTENASSNVEFRHLIRGAYGNSTEPLHGDDLEKWVNYVNSATQGKTVFKVFDYNSNIAEFEECVKIIKASGAKVEIAIPHSPDEEKGCKDFFKAKVEELCEFAGKNGADISVKRMVAGLKVEEAEEIADIVFSTAKRHGIQKVGLHAHGDNPEAVAAFIKKGIDNGISVNADFGYEGSNAFPSAKSIVQALEKMGVESGITKEQVDVLDSMNDTQVKRDQKYEFVKARTGWTTEQKEKMGMPDGGESYSLEAIEKTGTSALGGYLKSLAMHLKGKEENDITHNDIFDEKVFNMAKDVFEVAYLETRKRFGMPTGVTPGHKRIETLTIYAANKVVDSIITDCISSDKTLDREKLSELISSKTHQDLYSGAGKSSPDIIDAFRNDLLPKKLDKDAMVFLCSEHMQKTLTQKAFDGLTKEEKGSIITEIEKSYGETAEFYKNNEQTRHDDVFKKVKEFVDAGKLPSEVLTSKDEKFNPISLMQAHGRREYVEGAKAREKFTKCLDELKEKVSQGAEVTDETKQATFAATLALGNINYVNGITYDNHVVDENGKNVTPGVPSAKDYATKEEFSQAKKEFLTKPNAMAKYGKKEDRKILKSSNVKGETSIHDEDDMYSIASKAFSDQLAEDYYIDRIVSGKDDSEHHRYLYEVTKERSPDKILSSKNRSLSASRLDELGKEKEVGGR
jgi:hypothetical protein